jgi:putative effector of murein hydrolase LrgA (UPF0299 family)
MYKTGDISPGRFSGAICAFLFMLVCFIPPIIGDSQMQIFGVQWSYFYIIILGPALILFVTSWAASFMEKIDRSQLETEND